MKILKLSSKNFQRIIKITTESIKKGKVIIFPTDTVYGLIADATNKRAVERVFKIKKRNFKKPIPIFVKDLKQTKEVAKADKNQEKFLKTVWPGKVTIVLERTRLRQGFGGQRKVKIYGVDKKTIGLRIPNYKLINILLKKLNLPLTGTSANISGQPATTQIKEVLKQFKNQRYCPDLIIDAGNLPKIKPSIVLDLNKIPPIILRK